MKLTNKRTHLVFQSMEDKRKAEDFLLAMNYNFQGIVKRPVLIVAPKLYIKGYLDLYLLEHKGLTTFKYQDAATTDRILSDDYMYNFLLNDKRESY